MTLDSCTSPWINILVLFYFREEQLKQSPCTYRVPKKTEFCHNEQIIVSPNLRRALRPSRGKGEHIGKRIMIIPRLLHPSLPGHLSDKSCHTEGFLRLARSRSVETKRLPGQLGCGGAVKIGGRGWRRRGNPLGILRGENPLGILRGEDPLGRWCFPGHGHKVHLLRRPVPLLRDGRLSVC